MQPVNLMRELLGSRALLREPDERSVMFGLHLRERRIRILPRKRRGLFRILRHRELTAKLIHLGL